MKRKIWELFELSACCYTPGCITLASYLLLFKHINMERKMHHHHN
jgi:hypothetical protein